MEIIFPKETNHIGLLIPLHLMQHYFGEESFAYALTSRHHHLKCNLQRGCNLITQLDRMISKYMTNPALLADAHECKAAELQLINDLAESFDVFHRKTQRVTPSQRCQILHRAINFSKNLHEPITVPELTAASGMSQRSLELAFQESLGITPRQYLHRHRLNGVYSELLVSDPGSTMVTKIAEQWGFTELGRFAGYYKHLFGESPSVTLNRRKAPLEKRLSDVVRNK
jgi:AraC-like DNA-binding protein